MSNETKITFSNLPFHFIMYLSLWTGKQILPVRIVYIVYLMESNDLFSIIKVQCQELYSNYNDLTVALENFSKKNDVLWFWP